MCQSCRDTFIKTSCRTQFAKYLRACICNCNIVKDNVEDSHRLKGDRVIVKLSKRRDCQQVLSVKNALKNINMADLGFEENASIYISH